MFVADYDGAGVHVWSKRFGGTGDDAGLSLQIAGPVYCTGYFRQTVNFGGANLVSAGGQDIFLAKFDASGAHQFSRRWGGTSHDTGSSLHVGDRIFIGGQFENSVHFGSSTLTSAGGSDGFLTIYNESTGLTQRNIRIGGPENDTVVKAASFKLLYPSPAYDFLMVGTFGGTIDLGGGPLVSAGSTDGFLVHYSETWVTPVGPPLPKDELAITSYPNPFNPQTTITYSVPSDGRVSIAIYDVNGAHVASLVDNQHRVAGAHEARWEGRSSSGMPVASGIYFAQIDHAGARQSTRLVLLK
jgi:hypothetical protein